MKKTIFLMFSLLLAGCASTTILPEGNGKYSLVTTSFSESSAFANAKQKAVEECQKQSKQLVVLNHKSTYQGIDKKDKAMLNIAGALINGNSSTANSSDDYEVTMKFRCK